MQTSDQPERSTAKDTFAPALVGSNLAEERSARHPRTRSHRLAGIEAAEETYLAGMAHYATIPPQTESECRDYRNNRLETEYWLHQEQLAQIDSIYNDAS